MDTPEQTPEVAAPIERPEIAPGIDIELDNALQQSFKDSSDQPEPKQNNEIEKPVEKEQPSSPKKESDSANVDKGELPEPESIQAGPPGKASKESKDGWNALRSNYKRAREIVTQKDEEIKKLKTDLAERGTKTAQEVETLKKELQETAKYRAMVDIQADPEFLTKYEKPVEDKVNELVELLTSNNVSEEVARSINWKDTAAIAIVAKAIIEHKDDVIAEDFRTLAREARSLINARDKAVSEQSKTYKETLENRKKEAFTKTAESEGKALSHLKTLVSTKDEQGNYAIPFLNKMTPKEGAAEGDLQQIENHNKVVDLFNKKIDEAFKDNTPEAKAELVIAAIASHYFKGKMDVLLARNKSLEAELKKISNVSTETEKKKVNTVSRNGNRELDLDSAMSEHFNR